VKINHLRRTTPRAQREEAGLASTVTIGRGTPRQWAMPARGDWIAAAVLLIATFATRAIWFGDPVAEFDEQLYSFIGWRMTQGDLPYVEVWDRKPFGLFAIFALAHWLFGPGPIAYQLVASVSAFAGTILVYILSKELVDRASAVVAGVLYLMLMAAYGSYSGQSEIFHTPLMLAMLWLLRDWRRPDATRRALLAMLIGGIAMQVKYTVLPQCLFFGAYALYGQWRAGASLPRLAGLAAMFAVLGVLPTALVGLLYAAWGHFVAFWFANFVSFFDRAPSPYGRIGGKQLVGAIPIAVLVGMGFYAALRLNPPRDWRTYGLYAGWGLAAIGTVLLPATVYLYYYGALVPAAVLVALPLIDRKAPAKFIPAAFLLLGMAWILNLPDRYGHSQDERRTEARLSAAIAPYVGQDTDCLYVFDGPTALYRTTGTCLPTKFIYPDHLNNALEIGSLGVEQLDEIARILANRPGVIVTADIPVTFQRKENLALIAAATARDYRPLITSTLHGRWLTAWVRRDLAGD
jgi:4-amino-4-deoxy-L-arabinose transferase-like glycosyltransferase